MRIRKHAKISPLLYAASSLHPPALLQTHVCVLNQSPWDVLNFSPPPTPPLSQVNGGSDGFATNGSARDSIPVVIGRETNKGVNDSTKREYSDGWTGGATAATADETSSSDEDGRAAMCCKTDGKSWKCPRLAAKGHSLCEHHLSMVRSYSNSCRSSSKNSAKSSAEGRSGHRAKKRSNAVASSNPYAFYYYSGFGPKWGKKRGEFSNGDMPTSSVQNEHHRMEPSHLHYIDMDDDEFNNYTEEEEEDDEDDDTKNDGFGKKRSRKRIKARSLKSLM